MSTFDLSNYEGANDTIKRFWNEYPMGRIVPMMLDVDLNVGYILFKVDVYRDSNDLEPAVTSHAYGHVATYQANMKKWFVEDTETSAISRAIKLLTPSEQRPSREDMSRVEVISTVPKPTSNEPYDPWATSAAAPVADAWHCKHGERMELNGEKNGKEFYGMGCRKDRNSGEQCPVNWFVLNAEGVWVPKLESVK